MRILFKIRYAILAVLSSILIITSSEHTPFSPPCEAPDHPDYAPLMALYNATDGPNWNNNTGWGEDCDVCGWYGVTCSSNRVKNILLNNNNLTGVIPPEIAMIDSLEGLDLRQNDIQGPLPVEIGSLDKLTQLGLTHNPLNIEFPTVIFNLPSLKVLQLANCGLTGTLPDDFNSIPRLSSFDLSSNELGGSIPPSIFTLSELYFLDLSNNEFVGGFPDLFEGLPSLKFFSAASTSIGGDIPSSIGKATQLESINLANSVITGPIPESLYSLSNLKSLQLQNNQITGSLNSKIDNLTSLKILNLSNNEIEGEIPLEMGNLLNINQLNLQGNQLSGEIPEELYNLTSLTFLNLSSNNLVGPISVSIGYLVNLSTLIISRNNWGGELPTEFNKLNKLLHLNITAANIGGEISNQFDGLINLRYVYLGENNLSGSYPQIFGELPAIERLNLSNNMFSNCIPDSYSKFCTYSDVYFDNNCNFENPTFDEFCAGAPCNNTLNMSASAMSVCEGDLVSIQPGSSYSNYQWSEPNQTSKILTTTATTSKYYYITVTNNRGCTKSDSIYINVVSSEPGFESAEICPGRSVEINGETFDEMGNFQQLIPRPGFCDSIVNVTITLGESTSGSYAESICPGTFATVNGQDFGPGISTQTIENQAGCDSLITITIDEYPAYETNLTFEVCEGETYHFEGEELPVGLTTLELESKYHCDSIIYIDIKEKARTFETISVSYCEGGNVEINNETYNTAASYTQTLINAAGCDSMLTIIVTERPVSFGNVEAQICDGDSVLIAGNYYTTNGTFSHTLTNSENCDSFLNISISTLPSETISLDEFICQEESFEIGTQSFSSAGTYEVVLENQYGCDSVINLNLTIITGEDQILNASTCAGTPYEFAGKLYYESTVVQDSIVISGCKSLTTLNLEVIEPLTYEYDEFICEDGSAYFFGYFYSEPTTQYHTIKSNSGCDSTIIMNLHVEDHKLIEIDTFICVGESLYFDNQFYYNPGRIEIPRKTGYGCDSLTILNILEYETVTDTFYAEVCTGNETEFQGEFYGKGDHYGTYDDGNCTQNFMLIVNEVEKLRYNEVLTICEGGEIEFLGKTYSEGGFYQLDIDISDCEILEKLVVLEKSSESLLIPQVFCEGTSFELDGKLIDTSGNYFVSTGGCDDEFVSILFVNGEPIEINKTIKEGDAIALHGSIYSESGSYEIIVGSEYGCPTLLTLNLIVESCNGLRTEKITLCEGDSYEFYDQFISKSGTYEYKKSLSIGCDSVIQLSATFTTIPEFNINGENYVCEGDETILSGPEGYRYLWSTGSESSSISVSSEGKYELIIFDENNCYSTAEIYVETIRFPSKALGIYVDDPSTCEASDGEITIDAENADHYLFSIDGGMSYQASNLFKDLSNGQYKIVLSDSLQRCTKEVEFPIILESDGVPQIKEINIIPINDCQDQMGSIQVIPASDTDTFQFSINNGATWYENGYFENLNAGVYQVLMGEEGSMCLNNLTPPIELENIGYLNAEIEIVNPVSCNGAFDGVLNVTILDGQAPFQLSWSNGSSAALQSNLSSGEYLLTITDANSCEQILDIKLDAPDVEDLLTVFQDTIICADETLSYKVDSAFHYIIFKENEVYYEGKKPEISETGRYQIVLENGASCVADKYIEVSEVDLSALGIDFLLSTEAVKNVEVIAINVSDPMPEVYEWVYDTSKVSKNTIDPFASGFTFSDTGKFVISLYTEIEGCLANFDKTIVVYADSSHLGTYEEPVEAIDLDQFGSWKVFENPSNGQFYVEVKVSTAFIPINITIYDIYGGLIERRVIRGQREYLESFNLSGAGTGIYTVVLSALGHRFSKNILIVN